MPTENLRELDRIAVLATVPTAQLATPDRLGDPTPCADWNIGELLAHMAVQNRGFAASARGAEADLTLWESRTPGPHTPAEYAESVTEVLAAFEPADVLDRIFAMPEFGPGVTVPGDQALGFHLVDYVLHGWDLARALGRDYELDQACAEPVLNILTQVPDGPERESPGSPFARAVPGTESGSALDRILRLSGRRPEWSAAG